MVGTLTVSDYRGISRATIQLAPTLTLIAGRNNAGKSSLYEALTSCLTGSKQPVAELKVSESHMLVHDGAPAAAAKLTLGSGGRQIQWCGSGAEILNTEPTPKASAYASGREDFLALKPADRAKELQERLKFEVTEEELAAALPEISPERIKHTWATIKLKGWDSAHADAKATGTKLKAQWEQLTGLNFKPTVAQWQPEGVEPGRDYAPDVAAARATLEQCIAAQAISSAEKDRLTALASRLDALVADANKYQAAEKNAEQTYRDLQANAPSVQPGRSMPCPSCKANLILCSDMTLKAVENAPTAEEQEQQQRDKEAHERKVNRAREEWINARTAYEKVAEQARTAHVAKITLDEQAALPPQKMPVDEARAVLALAEQNLKLSQAATQADQVHANFRKNLQIIDALAADGLRQQKLGEVLAAFNAQLKLLSDMAGWADVVVRPDMSVTFGRRPLALVSASEKFRARFTIQCAFAQIEKASLIALDAADILDNPNRAGLAKLSQHTGIPVVCFMTASAQRDVPNLAEDGRGLTYWVEGTSVIPYFASVR